MQGTSKTIYQICEHKENIEWGELFLFVKPNFLLPGVFVSSTGKCKDMGQLNMEWDKIQLMLCRYHLKNCYWHFATGDKCSWYTVFYEYRFKPRD